MGKLGLNQSIIDEARGSASRIAEDTQRFIDQHTTISTERAVLRLLGIDGVNELEAPLVNVVADKLNEKGLLCDGAAYFMGCAMLDTHKNPQEIAEAINNNEIDVNKIARVSKEKALDAIMPIVKENIEIIKNNRKTEIII
jgi:D-Lysine 5,6-aminomutase alpha subunit.